MKTNSIILLLFFLSNSVHSQIVNIENKRIATDTTGFAGNFGVSLSAAKFTQTFVSFDFHSQVQWKTKKNLFLLIGDVQIVNAGGENFNNSGFGHFRYNRKLNPTMRLELFTQIQYNSVTKLNTRLLSGVGLRFKLSQYESAKIYWGITGMHEYEILTAPEIVNKDVRLSSYLTFTLLPVETISLQNTTYIQPLIDDFNDFRFSNNTLLNFGITENLKFVTTFSFLFDSHPPLDIPRVNYQVKNGITYRFN